MLEMTDAIGTSADKLLNFYRLVHFSMRNWLEIEGSLVHWINVALSRLEEALSLPEDVGQERNIWRSCVPHVHDVLELKAIKRGVDNISLLLYKYGRCQ